MLIEFWFDLAKLLLIVVGTYAALSAYARRVRPQWTERITRRRFTVLALLMLAVSSVKLFEDVIAKESGPIDTAVLLAIRDVVPHAAAPFFEAITQTGSAAFLMPAAAIAAVALLLATRKDEALLLLTSFVTATLTVYVLKALIGRERPALWETQWYWGSSFPSGHTLSTAAFSAALALCIHRIWPRAGIAAMAFALAWTCLVALSRLVLGVHWPSDVLAAMCVGLFIPLAISLLIDWRQRCRQSSRGDRA